MIAHPPGTWTVDVGWTSTRPIRPDEHTTRVHVLAHDEHEASLLAAQMVCAVGGASPLAYRAGAGTPTPVCEMPTSTRIVAVEF